jgi:hypothetical protein
MCTHRHSHLLARSLAPFSSIKTTRHSRWAGAGLQLSQIMCMLFRRSYANPCKLGKRVHLQVCVPNREVERSRYALRSRSTCAKVAKVGIPLGSCDEIVAYLAIFRQVFVLICDARSSKHLALQKTENITH